MPHRCDDLESLGYVIVCMLKEGSSELPWSGSTSIQHGLDMKRNTSLGTLCEGCPVGMLAYMKAARAMTYDETPDYDLLDGMLVSMLQNDSGEPAAESAGTAARSVPCSTRGAPASAVRKRKQGRSERSRSEHPMKLRRSKR